MWLDTHEGTVRLASFAAILVVMAGWEVLAPKRDRQQTRLRRWSTNLSIVILDTVLLRILFPVLAIGVAAVVSERGWGLFGLLQLPVWFEILLAITILDAAIYAQHVASHHVPMLWRFHAVHHADRDIDVTTALRFHPVEIVLSMIYKMALVVIVGPAAMAVFLFEVILNGSAMFNHGNVRLPQILDRVIRALFVTPDMHRVHHSVRENETNSNFGFCLSVWDRVFGTYTAQPADGHDRMTIGLAEHQTALPGHLSWSLLVPFRKKP